MPTPLRILLLEDNEADAQLVLHELRRAGFNPSWERVDTEAEYLARLDPALDLILSDYTLPQLDALRALQLLHERRLDVPFVIVSGSIGEDIAVAALQRGAADYFLKDRLGRLGEGIKHVLEQKRLGDQRRLAEEALRASEERFRNAFDYTNVPMVLTDTDHRFVRVNAAFAQMFGYTPAELLCMSMADITHPNDLAESLARREALRAGDINHFQMEKRYRHKDGRQLWGLVNVSLIRDAHGRPLQYVGQVQDITERKQGEESLSLFRALVDRSNDAIELIDPESGRFLDMNEKACQSVGYTREEFLQLTVADIDPLVARRTWLATTMELRRTGSMLLETLHLRKDGTTFPVEVNVRFVQLNRGYHVAIVRDITDRKKSEEALRQSEERYRQLFENNPQPLWVYDAETLAFLAVNEAAVRHYGYSRAEFLGMTIKDIRPAEDIPNLLAVVSRPNAALDRSGIWRHRKKDGAVIDVEIVSHEFCFDGRRARLVLVNDVTERRRAQAARQRLIAILEATPDLVAISQVEGPASYINLAGRKLLGLGPDEEAFLSQYRPPSARQTILEQAIPTAMREGVWSGETVLQSKAGEPVPVSQVLIAHKSAVGEVEFLSTIARDIRGRKLLEDQLRQAQKMEAIGRLAGGIAHDFNNLLTVIIGFSDIALGSLRPGDPLRAPIEQIKKSGERAALLTRQLLAFSRKQMLQPVVLDLNHLLAETEKMLRRVIGEDIELGVRPAPDLWRIKADPGQLEQVVMNLAVNARDAMPTGGELSLATANVELDAAYVSAHPDAQTGPHAVLTVSDTGCGMDAATLARIFEPFFTTKGPEKGTGLGLATVYGIVRQSGGHIEVSSEPGRGTTFKVYLPREHAAPLPAKDRDPEQLPGRGSETVLLAEDEEGVRTLARLILQRNGYQVLEAPHGGEALLICERHQGTIHLLITDVVMPSMSGRQLADRLRQLRPGMKTLYLSGYTDDAVVRHGAAGASTPFLQKPFSPEALVRKVREVLAG